MRRLTIIGTTPNGDGVILSDGKGAKFVVVNDPRLVAVTDHDLSRQLEMALQTFSPREIQARVRSGASAEIVAAETGWPLDKVLRYAEPLLDERAFIAQKAQTVEIRRSGGGASLASAASTALGADPSSIAWDAWRREDGKWVVTASYSDSRGAHAAQWTYDHAGRNVHPLDDDARRLMGASAAPAVRPDGIDDALELIAERPEAAAEDAESESRPRLMAVPDAPADATASPAASATSETVTIPRPEGDETPAKPAARGRAKATPKAAAKKPAKAPADTDAPADGPAGEPAKPAARKKTTRKGRASVPSWDEILFGATRTDD